MDEKIEKYLRDHLSISIDKETDYDEKKINVNLLLDNEVISSDSIWIESCDD